MYGEYSDIFEALYRIEGLDVAAGMSNVAGNKSVYLCILRQFCNEFDGSVSDIMRFLVDRDLGNYTIKLHAMKGAFANLGAGELSKWAHRLEVASGNGKTPLCQSETKAFCEKMKLPCDRLLETTLNIV